MPTLTPQERRTRKNQILKEAGATPKEVEQLQSDVKFIDYLRRVCGVDPLTDTIEEWGRDV